MMTETKKESGAHKIQISPHVLLTSGLVVLALILGWIVYSRYVSHPWTRDGQIRADIVGITCYVSGKVVNIHVKDEALVEAGQLLFEIDPRSYEIAVESAQVALDEARQQVASLEASVTAAKAGVEVARAGVDQAKSLIVQYKAKLKEVEREAKRNARLAQSGAGSIEEAQQSEAKLEAGRAMLDSAVTGLVSAEASLASAIAAQEQAEATLGAPGDDNVRIRAAQVDLESARLNLNRTKVYAPSSGWVTNLTLRRGDWATPGVAMMSFVDKDSLRVSGFFKETQLQHIRPGDRASIKPMGWSGRPIQGVVETIGRAINPPQIATLESSSAIVPSVSPTYDWIRLAQRVPVQIRFVEIPDDFMPVSGRTVSVAIGR